MPVQFGTNKHLKILQTENLAKLIYSRFHEKIHVMTHPFEKKREKFSEITLKLVLSLQRK